jgi:hypothetical protein
MTTEGREPIGERKEHYSTRSNDTNEFVEQNFWTHYMLQNVRGMADVERAVGKRKFQTIPDDAVAESSSSSRHFLPVGFHEDADCARTAEGFGEVAGASPNVDHALACDRLVALDERHRVLSEERVEPVWVVELRPESLKQIDRALQSVCERHL